MAVVVEQVEVSVSDFRALADKLSAYWGQPCVCGHPDSAHPDFLMTRAAILYQPCAHPGCDCKDMRRPRGWEDCGDA